jgi:hypothetical protein
MVAEGGSVVHRNFNRDAFTERETIDRQKFKLRVNSKERQG